MLYSHEHVEATTVGLIIRMFASRDIVRSIAHVHALVGLTVLR